MLRAIVIRQRRSPERAWLQHRSFRPRGPGHRGVERPGLQFAKTSPRRGAVVLAGRRVERLKTLRAEIRPAAATPRGRLAGRDRPRQHQGGRWRTPRPRWARSTSWSTTRASAPRSAGRRDAGGLRLRLRHQHQGGAFFVAQEGRQAHAGACKGRAPRRHLHRRAHRQHRLDGRPARARPDRRVLHEQGGGDPHDARDGARVGGAGASTSTPSARATSTPRSTTTTGRPSRAKAGRHAAARASASRRTWTRC